MVLTTFTDVGICFLADSVLWTHWKILATLSRKVLLRLTLIFAMRVSGMNFKMSEFHSIHEDILPPWSSDASLSYATIAWMACVARFPGDR